MFKQARSVESNQDGPHADLLKLVDKHRTSVFKRPIAAHTQDAFDQAMLWLSDWQGDVILDACCGVGESTLNLAIEFPNARILGVDKSSDRLQKHTYYAERSLGGTQNGFNYLILQADLNDFWRLLSAYLHHPSNKPAWRLSKQYILYPNPYPKKAQVGKRWHASPIFGAIVECCPNIEVRSNWKVYIEEFVLAAQALGVDMQMASLAVQSKEDAMTPFERKYAEAGQLLWTATTLGTGCDK